MFFSFFRNLLCKTKIFQGLITLDCIFLPQIYFENVTRHLKRTKGLVDDGQFTEYFSIFSPFGCRGQ